MKKIGIISLFCLSIPLCAATTINQTNMMTNIPGGNIVYSKLASVVDLEVRATQWLAIHGRQYITLGGAPDDDGSGINRTIHMYEFNIAENDVTKLLLADKAEGGGSGTFGLSWFIGDNDIPYLATGSGSATDQDTEVGSVRVYRFNPNVGELSKVAVNNDNADSIFQVAWVVHDDKVYLAAGGAGAPSGLRLFLFNQEVETLTLEDSEHSPATVYDLQWFVVDDTAYLIMGGSADGGNLNVKIFQLDTTNDALDLVASKSVQHGGLNDTIDALHVVQCNNAIYLALGTTDSVDSGIHIQIYQLFANNEFADFPSATPLIDFTNDEWDIIHSVRWLNEGCNLYLGAVITNDPSLYVFRFIPGAPTLTQLFTFSHGTGGPASYVLSDLVWLQRGPLTYLLTGGRRSDLDGNTSTRLFQVNFVEDAINALMRQKYYQNYPNNAPEDIQRL